MISQSRTPAGILRTLTAILCLAAILMSVTGSSAWAAPRVVRVVGIQDGISDSQADYFRRTIAELNDLTEDRIFVTRPIPAASSLDLNAYQGLDFAIVSPRVFALLERYNGFIPMASLSVDIPDCEPGAELRPVVSALVFATPDADEDGLAKPHLSDIAGETVTVVKGDEVDTTFLLQNELSSRRLAPVKVACRLRWRDALRDHQKGGRARRQALRGLDRPVARDEFRPLQRLRQGRHARRRRDGAREFRDPDAGTRVRGGSFGRAHGAARICRNALRA